MLLACELVPSSLPRRIGSNLGCMCAVVLYRHWQKLGQFELQEHAATRVMLLACELVPSSLPRRIGSNRGCMGAVVL